MTTRIDWQQLRDEEESLTQMILGSARTQNHPVDDCNLSAASKSALKKYGFNYLDDLVAISPEYLMNMRPFKDRDRRAADITTECMARGIVIGYRLNGGLHDRKE
jgi:DNA-directed RNA polymerase alpha subunit